MNTTNIEIRSRAKMAGVFFYEIAERMGMQDSAFSRIMRHELSAEKRDMALKAIEDIANDKSARKGHS